MKTKIYKVVAILLALTMILNNAVQIVSAAQYSGKCGDNLTYIYDEDKFTLTISGTGDMYDYSEEKDENGNDVSNDKLAPWTYKYYDDVKIEEGVSSIGTNAFIYGINRLYIPKSMKRIKDKAFGTGVNTVIFAGTREEWYQYPDDFLSQFGEYVEKEYENGKDKIFNSKTYNLNKYVKWRIKNKGDKNVLVFSKRKKTKYFSIPNYKLKKGKSTAPWAKYASKIHDIQFNVPVKSIGNYAFYGCSRLSDVTIKTKHLSKIGKKAFGKCSRLKEFKLVGNYVSLKYSNIGLKKGTKIRTSCGHGSWKKHAKQIKSFDSTWKYHAKHSMSFSTYQPYEIEDDPYYDINDRRTEGYCSYCAYETYVYVCVSDCPYTGTAIEYVNLKFGWKNDNWYKKSYDKDIKAKNGIHYTLKSKNNIDVGNATSTISMTKKLAPYFGGSWTLPYKIVKEEIGGYKIQANPKTMTYDGTEKTPDVKITTFSYLGSVVCKFQEGVHYFKHYSDNINVGRSYIYISDLEEDFNESRDYYDIEDDYHHVYTYFDIVPKGTAISKLTKSRKAFTVKWKKQSKKMPDSNITGYQIQYATNKKMTKGKKTIYVKGYNKVSRKITKLKARKNYYVRVRTYMTINGRDFCSNWSKIRSIKTK